MVSLDSLSIGQARYRFGAKIPLLALVPWGAVKGNCDLVKPDKAANHGYLISKPVLYDPKKGSPSKGAELDHNHSHFILVSPFASHLPWFPPCSLQRIASRPRPRGPRIDPSPHRVRFRHHGMANFLAHVCPPPNDARCDASWDPRIGARRPCPARAPPSTPFPAYGPRRAESQPAATMRRPQSWAGGRGGSDAGGDSASVTRGPRRRTTAPARESRAEPPRGTWP
jgi:hypothetical protein